MSTNQPDPTLLGPPWPASTTLNEGIIHVGGKPITELAAQFGTPAYILDVEDLRSRARAFKEAFDNAFGYPVGVFYASKAFTSTAVLRWLTAEGLGVDCSTAGELAVALAAGVDPGVIGLHGNNKSDEELTQALTAGVGRIIIDSLTEINRLARVAETLEVERVPVMIRLTTGVHAGGHEFIATAHEDQKFGLSIASGAAKQAVEHIQAQPRLELMGLHSHIGSQILSTDGFANAARAVLEFRAELASLGIEVEEVDLGGGYGIAYLPGEADLDPRDAANTLAAVVKDESERLNLPPPRVSIEPGRAIVGPTMLTVYEIGTIKQVQTDNGSRTYVSVDGGMSDNIRPILYDAAYTARVANRVSSAPSQLCRIVGKHCESGDVLIPDIDLPQDVRAGDLLIVAATGAYGRSLASNYNQVPRPGVVAVEEGQAREILRRETVEDLLRLDVG